MAEFQDGGLLLRRVAYSDTSYIIHVLSRSHGRLVLMARGARRPKSPFRPGLEPLHDLRLRWRPGRTGMGTLTDVDRGEELVDAGHSLEGLQLCALASQLFLDGDPQGYDELGRAFALLEERPVQEGMLSGIWSLLSDHGLIGPLDHCWQCAEPSDVLSWHNAECCCPACGRGGSLSPGLRRAVPALMHSAGVRLSRRDLTTWQQMIQDVLRRHGIKPLILL